MLEEWKYLKPRKMPSAPAETYSKMFRVKQMKRCATNFTNNNNKIEKRKIHRQIPTLSNFQAHAKDIFGLSIFTYRTQHVYHIRAPNNLRQMKSLKRAQGLGSQSKARNRQQPMRAHPIPIIAPVTTTPTKGGLQGLASGGGGVVVGLVS